MAPRSSVAANAALSAPSARLRLATLGLPLVLLVGLALRLAPWLANPPLHHDEALYGAWARLIAEGRDPLLLTSWVDKPPLTLYLLAGSLRAFGVSEIALRLPGMLAGLLLIPVTWGLARRACGPGPALLAAALVALSPFAIAFSPTAFTDGWLTLWLVAAAWSALAGRPFVAGLLLGLAVASKQQGVLGMPLLLPLLALGLPAGRRRGLRYLAAFGLALLGFALILAPVTWWDSLRWHNRPSFWDRSLQTYGGLVVAPLSEWPQRAVTWAGQLRYLFGLPVLSWLALGGLLLALPFTRRLVDRILMAYTIGYLVLHVIVTFQPWDRYLLPLVPLVSVLLARIISGLYRHVQHADSAGLRLARRNAFFLGAIALAAALLWGSRLAASDRLPVGSNGAVYDGVATAAQYMQTQDADAIVYYRRLGWHLDYYLFDAPQERRWYGDAAKIAADAGQTARREASRDQWLMLPAWEDYTLAGIRDALARQALRLEPAARVLGGDGGTTVTLYRIVPVTEAEVNP